MKKLLLCMLLMCIFLTSCSKRMFERNVFVMDTIADIRVFSGNEEIIDEICTKLSELDKVFSAYNGEVCSLNVNGGGEMSEHLGKILSLSIQYKKLTDGAFSPFLGNVIDLWGVGSKNYVPTDDEISEALKVVADKNFVTDQGYVTLKNGAKLNFGAIAKGYASDVIKDILQTNDCSGAVISLGGNVYVHGTKNSGQAWSVAIRDPQGSESEWVLSLDLSDKFVVSSGDYERYFESEGKRYHHILDPKTGRPGESDLSSVTIICDNGAMADAYSTALYVMGKEKALEFWKQEGNFEVVLITEGGAITLTEGLSDNFTPKNTGDYTYEIAYR